MIILFLRRVLPQNLFGSHLEDLVVYVNPVGDLHPDALPRLGLLDAFMFHLHGIHGLGKIGVGALYRYFLSHMKAFRKLDHCDPDLVEIVRYLPYKLLVLAHD